MGIYDRDYYRREGPSFLASITERGRVCKWLIAINAIVFVIQLATVQRLPLIGVVSAGSFTESLWLDPSAVLRGEVWRLLTAAFLHDTETPWHILINMLVLWWAGSELEERYGSKEFLTLYLTSAIFSGVIYCATMLGTPNVAVGASGGVTALLVILAFHDPHRTILLMFVIPVPIWLMVVGFVGYDLYVYLSRAATGVAVTGHLGGALFGLLYYKWHWHLTSLWSGLLTWRRRKKRPRLRVYRGETEEAPTPAPVAVGAPPAEKEIDEHFEAKLDAVLAKMSLVGKDNLTDGEREILLKASEIYRKRRS